MVVVVTAVLTMMVSSGQLRSGANLAVWSDRKAPARVYAPSSKARVAVQVGSLQSRLQSWSFEWPPLPSSPFPSCSPPLPLRVMPAAAATHNPSYAHYYMTRLTVTVEVSVYPVPQSISLLSLAR